MRPVRSKLILTFLRKPLCWFSSQISPFKPRVRGEVCCPVPVANSYLESLLLANVSMEDKGPLCSLTVRARDLPESFIQPCHIDDSHKG